MGPSPTSDCLKEGMMKPVVGKLSTSWGIGRLAVALDFSACPFATPTVICGAVVSTSSCGSEGAMNMWEAPESTMADAEAE